MFNNHIEACYSTVIVHKATCIKIYINATKQIPCIYLFWRKLKSINICYFKSWNYIFQQNLAALILYMYLILSGNLLPLGIEL